MNMTQHIGEVIVVRIPEPLGARQRSSFFAEFENQLEVIRPSIVIDCSEVRQMDPPTLELFLNCLEEAMKRNGDVRLAAVSPQARTVLESSGMAGLFQFYDTDVEAVLSFHRPLVVAPQQTPPPEFPHKNFGNAA